MVTHNIQFLVPVLFLENTLNHTNIQNQIKIIYEFCKNCSDETSAVQAYKRTESSQNTVQKCKKQ